MIYGVDVSTYQSTGAWSTSGNDFMIAKASLGMTVKDDKADDHAKKARDAGMVVGFYHFLWPSHDSGTGAQQADYFLSCIPGLRAGELLVCDWEASSAGEPSVADRDSFLNRLREKKPDFRIGLYANPSDFRDHPVADWVFAWPAWWTTKPGPPDLGGKDWSIWQYSDSNNTLDLDKGNFSNRQAMKDWAAGASGGGGDGGSGQGPLGLSKTSKWQRSIDQPVEGPVPVA